MNSKTNKNFRLAWLKLIKYKIFTMWIDKIHKIVKITLETYFYA